MNSENPPSEVGNDIAWSGVAWFMRHLSHDIRNELNLMELEASLLEESIAKGEAQKGDLAGLRAAMRQADARLRKVATRLQPIAPLLTPVRAEELMRNVWLLAERAKYVNDNDTSTSEAPDAVLNADIDLLSDAILEILANGSHFRVKDNGIAIRAIVSGPDLRISIQEKKTIAPSDLASWGQAPFAFFSHGSYGLGLNYAARIVATHRGRIERSFDKATDILETSILVPLFAQ